MSMVSLGLIVVTTPSTPVQLSAKSIRCNQINLQAVKGPSTDNVGNVYFGLAGLNRSTLAGVLYVLKPGIPAASVMGSQVGSYNDDLSNYWIDADNANDGVLVSYV